MSPPRCETCRWWEQEDDEDVEHGIGICRLFSDDETLDGSRPLAADAPEQKAVVAPFQGAQEGSLITDNDFGCVQWEAAPDG